LKALWFKRISGFALIPAVAMLSPLLLLPFITRAAGPEGWAAIATGQALGLTASLLIQFGWGTTGPPRVATLRGPERRDLYLTSVIMRVFILLLAVPVAVFISRAIVPPEWATVVSILCAASAVTGLGPGWYFVGIGRPLPLIWFETIPRLFGLLISTLAIALTGDLMLYALISASVEVLMATASMCVISRSVIGHRERFHQIIAHSKEQWSLALSALVSSGYTRLSVPIVSVVAYSQAPLFASADRVQTLSRSVIKPFVQSFQGWVGEARYDPPQFIRRFRIATLAVASVSVALAGCIAFLLPVFDTFLFGPGIPIGYAESALVGVAVLGIGLSNCTANFYLAPQSKIGDVARSTIFASVLGVPLIWLGTQSFGAVGALGAIGLVEIVVVIWQALSILRVAKVA
jgi:O-antigen/teichoic acid export membrane protein